MTHPLPEGYAVRPASPADVDAVLELITACDLLDFGEPDYTREDLLEEWGEIELSTDSWLVHGPSGQLAGYIKVDHRDHVRLGADGYVHPDQRGRGIATHLIERTESRARELAPLAPPGIRVTLGNATNSADEQAVALLRARGYTLARRFWRMAIEMDTPPAPPELPSGITIRTIRPGEEYRAVYEAQQESFRDHWGFVPRSFESWMRRTESASFDPSLWFLAEERGGIAGVALCTTFLEQGWVQTLGVRKPWRRRGVALGLLRHAFGEVHRRGRRSVALGVDSESPTGATKLYEKAGMRVIRQFDIYHLEVRPGREPAPEPEE
ncbi:MAG: GNAT family N-acetyltransferase [Chloroflexia bacterium]|nr:GNAT family N-acetyltransferase [Chloroflexia bacterium]